ncbi:MAG: hypothetical protein C0501_06560 [Isosphaera sp.]|nr:hypothetical protein [Isosphaera sp.]
MHTLTRGSGASHRSFGRPPRTARSVMSRHPPARRPRRLPGLRAAAAALALGAAGAAGAADPAAAPPAEVRVSDVVLARAALAALDADPDLAGVTVVVSVVDRVAVVGGPVATARQARRAEEVVRAVPGVAGVRNACFVTPGPDPLLRAVAGQLTTVLPPRPVMFDLPGPLTGALPTPLPAPMAVDPGAKTTVALRPAGEPGVLGAPVGPGGPRRPGDPAPAVAPGVLTAAGDGVPAAVAEVRRADPRFARLTAEFRDGTVVVGGSAPAAADAWDFAAKLRTIPGVTRVAVGVVNGK